MMHKRHKYLWIFFIAYIIIASACACYRPRLLLKYNKGSAALSIKRLFRGREPSWSPDGEKIIYNNRGISIVNLITNKQQALPIKGKNPCWSPSGEEILYSQNGIWRYTLDIKQATLLSPFGDHPLWSPKGDSIIFSYKGDVWKMNTKGDNKELFIKNGIPRAFSSDASFVLIEQWDKDTFQFTLALAEMKKRTSTPLMNGFQGSFSPDNTIVSYSANGIFLYNMKLEKKIKIINSGFAPAWSPKGDKLFFCDKGFVWLVDSISAAVFF